MKWLFWPVSLAAMSRAGCYLMYEVAARARIGGRYDPCWPLFCCMKWRFWPASLAFMSRIGRYLPYGVAVLARIGGRHEPYGSLRAA